MMSELKDFYGITNTVAGSVSEGEFGARMQSQEELNKENNSKLPLGMRMTPDGQNIDFGRLASDKIHMVSEMASDPKYANRLKEYGKQFGFDNLTPEKFQEIAEKEAFEMQTNINRFIPGTESHRLDVVANEINQNTKAYAGGGLVKPYDFAKKNNFEIEDYEDGTNRVVKITNPAFKYKYGRNKGMSPSLTAQGTYKQSDNVPTEEFINSYKFRRKGDLHFSTEKLATMLVDYSKSKIERGVEGLISGIGNLFDRSSGDLDTEKSTSGSDILGSNIEDIVDTQQDNKSLESISAYDEDFDSEEINVPMPLPSSNAPSSQGGGMIPIPVGASSRSLLNRYYKEQLLSFLYKV